jgi:hypothetical protein
MGKGEIWFSYNDDVPLDEFDVHRVKGKKLNDRGTTVIVSRCPEFHGKNTLAHRLFGWAIAMFLTKEGDVDINVNPKQQFVLPSNYRLGKK